MSDRSSPGSAGLSLAWSAPACEPPGRLSSTSSAAPSSPNASQGPSSTPTSERSERTISPRLVSSPADSPASRSATTATASEMPTSGGSGLSSRASFASFDPATSSWRTSQLSLDGGYQTFSEGWPRSGMTRSGRAYELRMRVPRIVVSGSSSWPTPNASDRKRVLEFSTAAVLTTYRNRKPGAHYLVEVLMGAYGERHTPTFSEWLMGFPLGWTAIDYEPPATPSCPRSLSGSGDASLPTSEDDSAMPPDQRALQGEDRAG